MIPTARSAGRPTGLAMAVLPFIVAAACAGNPSESPSYEALPVYGIWETSSWGEHASDGCAQTVDAAVSDALSMEVEDQESHFILAIEMRFSQASAESMRFQCERTGQAGSSPTTIPLYAFFCAATTSDPYRASDSLDVSYPLEVYVVGTLDELVIEGEIEEGGGDYSRFSQAAVTLVLGGGCQGDDCTDPGAPAVGACVGSYVLTARWTGCSEAGVVCSE